MRLAWARGRVYVGGPALALSDQAPGCGDVSRSRGLSSQGRSTCWTPVLVTDLGRPGSPTMLGSPCSRVLGILCCTQPGFGASWSWGDISPCPREPGTWLSPHGLRAGVSPQGAGTHVAPGRRCSHSCYIWKKFLEGSGGTHGSLCGRPPPTWGPGDGRPRKGWEHPSLELRSLASGGLSAASTSSAWGA